MKFFVISDTHGKLDRVVEVFNKLKDVDMIIHLGDFYNDAAKLEEMLGIDVIGVKGNMDGAYGQGEHKIIESEFGKILLVHGHIENVKSSLQNLLYKAEELGCKAALFGHTHEAYYGEFDGIYLLNPGSLPLPRNSNKASYGIINTKKDEFNAAIVYYDTISAKKPSSNNSKVEGGYLKNLLNNSDRF